MNGHTAPPPELRNLRYVRPLGAGGYSDVYLYEQLRPRREVAVKVLRNDSAAQVAGRRLETEADLMASVSRHPYIVTVLDADVAPDGREYIVMEYYPGQSLAARLRQGPLPTAEVLKIGIQLCGAVETAHRHGIVHRDIKPANILIDSYQHPKLTDFGIAGRRGQEGDGGMSPPWSAPEVVSGRSIPDERCDIYSLAATLWHLLAGHTPFEDRGGDNSQVALRRRIEHDPVPWIARPDVPQSLERVLQQAMSKNPAARFSSSLALARALQAVQQELGHTVLEPEVPQDPVEHDGRLDVQTGYGQVTDSPAADATDIRSISVRPQSPSGSGGLIDQLPASGPARRVAPAVAELPVPSLPPMADTLARPERPLDGSPAPAEARDEPASRRSGVLLLTGALVLLVAVTGVVFSLGRGRDRDNTEASSIPASPSPQDVLAPAAAVPAPTGSAKRVSATSVVFTWSVGDPQAVTFYVIRRTDAGSGARPDGQRLTRTTFTLTPIGPDDTPCLELRSGGKNGTTSAPAKVCL